MIEQYLRQLAAEAKRRRIDATRILTEVADHLDEAVRSYTDAGHSPGRAIDLAVTDLGDPSDIASAIAQLRGGPMQRTRITAGVVGLVSFAILWFSHIAPTSDIEGTTWDTVAPSALAVLLLASATLVGTSRKVGGILLAALGGGFTWAFATSALGDQGILIQNVSPTVAVVGLVGWGLCRVARIKGSIALAVMSMGATVLLLNGSWEELGGFGSGSANSGLLLLTLGWILLVANHIPTSRMRQVASRGRAMIARTLNTAARKIEPHPSVQ